MVTQDQNNVPQERERRPDRSSVYDTYEKEQSRNYHRYADMLWDDPDNARHVGAGTRFPNRAALARWIRDHNVDIPYVGRICPGGPLERARIIPGQVLNVPEGFDFDELMRIIPCRAVTTVPRDPTPDAPAPKPPTPLVSNRVVAPEYYPFQATTQGDNNNGLINAFEVLGATGQEPFARWYRRPDIMAREGSTDTRRSGRDPFWHNQGPRGDDTRLSRRDNDAPRLTEERHLVQGAFYGGNLEDGRGRAEAQRRFLNLEGFTGNDDHDWVSARVGLIIPFGGTREPRDNMNIGQTGNSTRGALMPTYTLSTEDFVNRDIWFFNNPAQTSAQVGTYDRALAHGDYLIVSREFRQASQELMERLDNGDTSITRADVQRVFNAGNYAQMNFLVRSSGIHHDLQTVMGDINSRFANYQWPATDQSPPLNLRNGTSLDILNTNAEELGGYRLRVMSAERREELADQFGAGFRFNGLEGIEGREFAGAYRIIHQRPTAVGQYIAEHRSTLVAGSREETQQRTTAALSAVLGTFESPNGAGATALWGQAAERPEIATSLVQTLSRAYENPELYGFNNRREVETLVTSLTGQPSERQRANDGVRGNEGDRGRNATDDAIGSSDGEGLGRAPIIGGYLSGFEALFGNNEGRMLNPQAFARIAAQRVGANENLQAATTRLLVRAPLADQASLLQTIGADPRVEANFGVSQSMRALATASRASVERDSPFFQGVVTSEVFSRSDYADVSVSSRGFVEDWMATYQAWQENGRQGANPTVAMSSAEIAQLQASGQLTPEMTALIASNNPNAATATNRNIVQVSDGDLSGTRRALAAGDTAGAFHQLVSGEQAQRSGSAELVVESMRFNPAFSANLVTATMLRDPAAFDQPIATLRALDRESRGGSFPLIGNLFGLLDADKYGQAASALRRSQERVRELGEDTLAAARSGDARALERVTEAMRPWNAFEARMMSQPTSRGAHYRYAAHEHVWDAIAGDERARTAMVNTISAEPQFREAAIEMLRLTPMQREDMREQQFIGRRGGDERHAIPAAVSGPAIDAASNMYVSFAAGRNGRIRPSINAAALVGSPTATVAASTETAPNSAAAAIAAGDTVVSARGDGQAAAGAVNGDGQVYNAGDSDQVVVNGNGQTTAAGGRTTAAGGQTTAAGGQTTAAGGQTTAAGGQTTAAGGQTTAAGGQTTAAGGQTTAAGGQTTAAGGQTTAAGGQTTAAGGQTTAAGGQTTAAGGQPVAASLTGSDVAAAAVNVAGDLASSGVTNHAASSGVLTGSVGLITPEMLLVLWPHSSTPRTIRDIPIGCGLPGRPKCPDPIPR